MMNQKAAVRIGFCLILCAAAQSQIKGSTEQEIRQTIERYDNALNHKDAPAAERFLAPNYVYFSSRGEVRSRRSLLNELLSPNYILTSADRSEINVYQSSDTAVVSSRWKGRGTSEGQPFHDDQRCSIVLTRENQEWRILSEHCTQIVAP